MVEEPNGSREHSVEVSGYLLRLYLVLYSLFKLLALTGSYPALD